MISHGERCLPPEAGPDDINELFDAIDVCLMLDDAVPSESADPYQDIELIPVAGLRRLAVSRNAGVKPNYAAVTRETPRPDIAPDAYTSEAFVLQRNANGKPTIRTSETTYRDNCQGGSVSLDDVEKSFELEEAMGLDRVDAEVCKALIRQISSTRVHPIQPL